MEDDMSVDNELDEFEQSFLDNPMEYSDLRDSFFKKRRALLKLHGWLVCAAIASPEDMAQSFEDMELTARLALEDCFTS